MMIRTAESRILRRLLGNCSTISSQAASMSQAAVGSTLQQQQSPAEGTPAAALDESLLVLLVCPLAKTPLRYDAQQQLLINDELGVSYPVVKGVPYLVPTHGKLLHQQQQQQQQEGWQAGNS